MDQDKFNVAFSKESNKLGSWKNVMKSNLGKKSILKFAS